MPKAKSTALEIAFPLVFTVLLLCGVAGCEKRRGEALVLGKEHIAAAEATSNETPAVEQRAMDDDEITVDGYVMKADVRGASRDPRALKDEQWLVKVRMVDGARIFNVPAEPSQFARLKEGDRVQVSYRVGKYTGTVWAAEIEAPREKAD